MPEGGGEISFPLWQRDPATGQTGWYFVRAEVGGLVPLKLVPNLFAPRSTLRTEAFERLREQGLVGTEIHHFQTRARTCVLHDLPIEGHPVPDLEVRVREDALFRRTDGYLGQDFFFHLFTEVCLNTRTFVMTLRSDP